MHFRRGLHAVERFHAFEMGVHIYENHWGVHCFEKGVHAFEKGFTFLENGVRFL